MTHILDNALNYAQSIIDKGDEPPWSWYQHMKLIEAIREIKKGHLRISCSEINEVNLPI